MPASNATSVVNGSGKKTRTTPESTVPPSPVSKSSETDRPVAQSAGKPNKIAYDAEQERLKSEIEVLQAKLNTVREKITMASKPSGNDRRNTLRAELDSIREQQSSSKTSRGKILDQLKTLQDGIQKKTKDLQAARGKTPFRSVEEVDVHIKNLEKQVESGSMKLVDEKRALQEISQAKRTRRAVEGFQATQDSIDADRNDADELRKQLDDPESKAISDRYDKIKAELDELKKESDEAYAGRTKLFEERDELQAQITALFNEKRSSAQQFREANDRYWTKVNEDRARRAERARAQRAAEEAQKRLEHAQQLREEASLPAYQAEMQDCQTLIDALSGKSSDTVVLPSSSLPPKSDVAGVPKLELRQVETAADGLVARKKKGEKEETYFMGKGKRGKKDKIPKVAHETDALKNLPFGTITALSKCAIPLPTTAADVPRVIEDLKTKKAWYEANQARVTAENIAKAEAQIQRFTNAVKSNGPQVSVDSNGSADAPLESVSTPVENVEAAANVDVDE
ncbi:hypothetical protein L210DRAFT_3386412 [Boletus edulis BED1]|uniref:Nuclear segregation protein Bfr1 n=1 Tax=Boletus edulis BED1 TaxID=1328754 RepID=A0AAD4C7M0_BOLED|nr:hypothetical protein L210DRAFT_3386412 [Boletus edulis BED1]